MVGILIAIISGSVGFLIGAGIAFWIGKKFIREQSRKLYDRWLRQERLKRRDWISSLVHDIKNPLFLIQAFSWTHLDRFKRSETLPHELKYSSEELNRSLNRQTDKALGILKEICQSEPQLPAPVSELWARLLAKKSLSERISASYFQTFIPPALMIPANWLILEEGLEDLLITIFNESRKSESQVIFESHPHGLRIQIYFKKEPPSEVIWNESKQNLEMWAENVVLVLGKESLPGIQFDFHWKRKGD